MQPSQCVFTQKAIESLSLAGLRQDIAKSYAAMDRAKLLKQFNTDLAASGIDSIDRMRTYLNADECASVQLKALDKRASTIAQYLNKNVRLKNG